MNLRLASVYNFHISKLFGSDLHLFELSVWIQSLGLSLISVFIPIILFQLGLSITEIVIYYLLFYSFNSPLNFYAKKVIEDRGARFAVIVSTIACILYFVLLFNLSHNWFLIILLALLSAIYDAFYWVGHLYIFARAAHHNSQLRDDIGMLRAVRILGALVAPIIGAYILINGGQKTLIFFSTIIMVASLIPLFRMRHLVFKPEQPEPGFGEFFKEPKDRTNYLLSALSALRAENSEVLWPFFIFFIYGSLQEVAYIPTLIAFSGLMLTFVAEKFSVKKNIYKMVAWGSFIIAAVWALRLAFYENEIFAIISVLLIAITSILIDIPIDVAIFSRAGKSNSLSAVTHLNFVRMISRAGLYLVLLIVVSAKVNVFIFSFWLVIFLMIVQYVVAKKAGKLHSAAH